MRHGDAAVENAGGYTLLYRVVHPSTVLLCTRNAVC